MNKENILKLADAIGAQEDTYVEAKSGFCMREYFHDNCMTPCCIYGWADYLAAKEDNDVYEWMGIDSTWPYLGDLFKPTHTDAHYMDLPGDSGYITAKHAARTLRHLAETGKVNWKITKGASDG